MRALAPARDRWNCLTRKRRSRSMRFLKNCGTVPLTKSKTSSVSIRIGSAVAPFPIRSAGRHDVQGANGIVSPVMNQYFGDINDYFKYGMLRAFGRELSVAVIWMMTPD